METFKKVKQRWMSETPSFFKTIRKVAITLGSSATAIWLTNDTMSLELHPNILEICKYIIAACAAMGLTAQLTRVNTIDENNFQ